MKKVVNLMVEIMANSLDKYLNIIPTLINYGIANVSSGAVFKYMFQFSNCNILGRYPIDFAISRYQLTSPSPIPPMKNPGSAPDTHYKAIVTEIGHHVSVGPG